MRMGKKCIFVLPLISFILTWPGAYAQETEKEPGLLSTENPYKTGVVFNVDDILLDLESYQGGIGFKRYVGDQWAVRGLFDAGASTSSNSWLLTLGGALEYHFSTGRLTPYAGGFLDLGMVHYKEEFPGDEYRTVNSFPVTFGPLFGVEIALFDFLSVFAEYGVQFDLTTTTTKERVGGVETKETDTDFSVETGIANSSKIGIVIYFNRRMKTKNAP